jgi:hypothetical protein
MIVAAPERKLHHSVIEKEKISAISFRSVPDIDPTVFLDVTEDW